MGLRLALWKAYLWYGCARVFDFWLGTPEKPRTHHFEIQIHRLPNGWEKPLFALKSVRVHHRITRERVCSLCGVVA